MSVITNNLLLGEDGYNISRSVRLRSSASAYFNRTLTTATSQQTFTFSCWLKRGKISSAQTVIGASGAAFDGIYFNSSDQLLWYVNNSPSITTTAVFRDPSAWYHLVLKCSGASSVLYVNNASVGTGSTAAVYFNTAISHIIGQNNSTNYFDGYLTEINFIDGQALTPSSFGETDSITGVWKPKKYAGTYGTNGFYLNFSDNSNNTAATIGKDGSGNGNNWTPNNISVTSGVTYDSMLDVPTMWADGGNGRGNYCVMNPVDQTAITSVTNGNLTATTNGTSGSNIRGTLAPNSGKWYWETTCSSFVTAGTWMIGFGRTDAKITDTWTTSSVYAYYAVNGDRYNGGDLGAFGSTYTTGDVIGIAIDLDSGKAWFSKNGTWQASGDPSSGSSPAFYESLLIGASITPILGSGLYSVTANFNFGQRPFAYTPPTGFKALNTQNLPDATIKKGNAYFDVSTYTGTGATQSITNNGAMQPDFVWIKSRNNASNNLAIDSVRGGGKILITELTDAEYTGTYLSSFNSNGFTIGATSSSALNASGYTYVGWQWKESVSAGFDIVTTTMNASGSTTINHNLGVTPSFVITKNRNGTVAWNVYSPVLGVNQYLQLNATIAATTLSGFWGAPTSTQFTFGSPFANTGTYVAYLFAEVAGYSKFGSYTGNGSTDGAFVYTGFRPRYILTKNITTAGTNWLTWDSSTSSYNASNNYLIPNSSLAEQTSGADIDILSNGFKVRNTSGSGNNSGATIIYAAFAENPFKNSLAR